MISRTYIRPKVKLLHKTPLQVAEVAGRTAYDSFDKSDFDCIKTFPLTHRIMETDIPDSKLLNQLAWVHFHHSVLEHLVLQFYIKDIGRGVLQELVRHRLASLTVKSTRYTLTPILLAYAISQLNYFNGSKYWVFEGLIDIVDPLVLEDDRLKDEEYLAIYNKIEGYLHSTEQEIEDYMSSAQLDILNNYEVFDKSEPEVLFSAMRDAKQKRNAGDNFKHIVSDNFKTELVWTINLRSLKNFLDLRDSGSAWFPIRELAQEIKNRLPSGYKELIVKAKQ